jgi:hypothetical protein
MHTTAPCEIHPAGLDFAIYSFVYNASYATSLRYGPAAELPDARIFDNVAKNVSHLMMQRFQRAPNVATFFRSSFSDDHAARVLAANWR